ncbi:MAG TPA: hypothetical protein DDZ51_07660 [Planctomycetaceae bacterium]|nr:hypothetical protein [Planctomycetaceae bacterium]
MTDLLLRRTWAGATLLLLLVSHRLWIPSPHWGSSPPWVLGDGIWIVDFPRVPMISLANGTSFWIDAVSLAALVVSLAIVAVRRDSAMSWRPMVVIAISFATLFVCNQHRLQPWAYQGWLYAILFACAAPQTARRWVILLTISIYAYSALGKFDQQFLKTVGPSLVSTLMPVGVIEDGDVAVDRWRWWIESSVVLLPVAELMIAGLLAITKTRRVGGSAAIAMHLSLIAILGPLGMGHSAAVLAWNLFLAIQSWMLFVRRDEANDSTQWQSVSAGGSRPPAVGFVAKGLILAAILLPMLERFPRGEVYGYWDHWLSWSLYSPHTSRVELQVHESAIGMLPKVVSQYSHSGDEDDGWLTIQVDRWSLAELAVPVYPQARFQLGVAHEIALKLDSEKESRLSKRGAIRIKIRGVADRRTGRREEIWAMGAAGIAKQRSRFWLLPR